MKEESLWRYLRDKVLPQDGHYTRVESDCSPGFPDVTYTLDGVTGFIELKSTKRPKAKYPFSGKDGLRMSQRIWIREAGTAGAKILLALQIDKRILLLDGVLHAAILSTLDLKGIESGALTEVTKGALVTTQQVRILCDLLTTQL